MTITATTEPRPTSPGTQRVRRYRERRREGLRLLTVEVPKAVIEQAIGRGMLKPEESGELWDVVQACYAAQVSDAALELLIKAGLSPAKSATTPWRSSAGSASGWSRRTLRQPLETRSNAIHADA